MQTASSSVTGNGSVSSGGTAEIEHAGELGVAELLARDGRVPAELARSVSADAWWSYILSRNDGAAAREAETPPEAEEPAELHDDAAPAGAEAHVSDEDTAATICEAAPALTAAVASESQETRDACAGHEDTTSFNDALAHALKVHELARWNEMHDEQASWSEPSDVSADAPEVQLAALLPPSRIRRRRVTRAALSVAGCVLASLLLSPINFGNRPSAASMLASPALASLGPSRGDAEREQRRAPEGIRSPFAEAASTSEQPPPRGRIERNDIASPQDRKAAPHMLIAAQSAIASTQGPAVTSDQANDGFEPVLVNPPRLVARAGTPAARTGEVAAASRAEPDYPANPDAPAPPRPHAVAPVRGPDKPEVRPPRREARPSSTNAGRAQTRHADGRGRRPAGARYAGTPPKAPPVTVASLQPPVYRTAPRAQAAASEDTIDIFGMRVLRELPPWAYEAFFGR